MVKGSLIGPVMTIWDFRAARRLRLCRRALSKGASGEANGAILSAERLPRDTQPQFVTNPEQKKKKEDVPS